MEKELNKTFVKSQLSQMNKTLSQQIKTQETYIIHTRNTVKPCAVL